MLQDQCVMTIDEAVNQLSLLNVSHHQITQIMLWSFEQIAGKSTAPRRCKRHWKLLATALERSPVVTISKQISFVNALCDALQSADGAMLWDIATTLRQLTTRFSDVFHPTLDSVVNLVAIISKSLYSTGINDQCPLIELIIQYMMQLFKNVAPRKSFQIITSKLFCPLWTIRRVVLSSTVDLIDQLLSSTLFQSCNISEFRNMYNHDNSLPKNDEAIPVSKKVKYEFYTAQLLSTIRENIDFVDSLPHIARCFLVASQSNVSSATDPERHRQEDRARHDGEFHFIDDILSIIVDSAISHDQQRRLSRDVFVHIHNFHIYHPNRDVDGVKRQRLTTYLNKILSHQDHVANPESFCCAIVGLLHIDHMIIEDHLKTIWQRIAAINHESSRILAFQLLSAYVDLRQVAVVLQAFIDAEVDTTLVSLTGNLANLFQLIPSPQFQSLISSFVECIGKSKYSRPITDVVTLLIDHVHGSHIPDIYDIVVHALNQSPNVDALHRLHIYASARHLRWRYLLMSILPDEIINDDVEFLSDLCFVDQDITSLVSQYHSSSPLPSELLACALHVIKDTHSRSQPSLIAEKLTSVIVEPLRQLNPEYWLRIRDEIYLLLSYARDESMDYIAHHIESEHLDLLRSDPRVLESEPLRTALIPFLVRSAHSTQGGSLSTLLDIPCQYIDDDIFSPLSAFCQKTIPLSSPIWSHVAILSSWPLMKLDPAPLLQWLFPDKSPQSSSISLLSTIIDHRVDDLIIPVTRLAMDIMPSSESLEIIAIITRAIAENLNRQFIACREEFFRPIQTSRKQLLSISADMRSSINQLSTVITPDQISSPQHVAIIAHLLHIQYMSSSSFTGSDPISMDHITALISQVLLLTQSKTDTEWSASSTLLMRSLALLLYKFPTSHLNSIITHMLSHPSPIVVQALIDHCNVTDFQTVLDTILSHFRHDSEYSSNVVDLLVLIVRRIRSGSKKLSQVLEKRCTIILMGIAHRIVNTDGSDHRTMSVLCALASDSNTITMTSQQVALIVQSLIPVVNQPQLVSDLSKIYFVLVKYRSTPLSPTLPLLIHQVLSITRLAIAQSPPSSITIDAISRVLVEIASVKAAALLIPRLLADNLTVLGDVPILEDDVRQAINQGLIALFNVLSRDQLLSVHASLSDSARSLFQTCHKQYLRNHKYYGRS
uniref:Nucleolar 27S pre-rRNA processing Urb2/Npa2 C-terminal domain-containing protein n=1 Tax=Spongospora subterranea TaxID=70186 RepID=A0A0H5QTL8_9EUKA|eukprot:CRZ04906.1 hypothetical protein [Spongospora subterranea]